MAIKIQCPNCQARMQVKDELAGRRIRCKSCSEVITVPQAASEEDEFDSLLNEGMDESESMPPPRKSQGVRTGGKRKGGGGSRASGNSKAAVWSLVLGILSMFCCGFFTGLPAIIVGIIALVNIANAAGALQGKGMAIAGVTTGALGGIVIPIVLHLVGLSVTAKLQSMLEEMKSGKSGSSSSGPADIKQRKRQLGQLTLALANYDSSYNRLPPGGIYDEGGKGYHSWHTSLLPYVEQTITYNNVDFNVPFNDPKNAQTFKTKMPPYLIAGAGPEEDGEGYGVSHYAGNSQLLNKNSSVRFGRIPDGASNTLLLGEAGGNFKPWGHPESFRDPVNGIGKPDGFGKDDGALFIMGDGSVKFIKSNVSPEILKALASPGGGEDNSRNSEAFGDP